MEEMFIVQNALDKCSNKDLNLGKALKTAYRIESSIFFEHFESFINSKTNSKTDNLLKKLADKHDSIKNYISSYAKSKSLILDPRRKTNKVSKVKKVNVPNTSNSLLTQT